MRVFCLLHNAKVQFSYFECNFLLYGEKFEKVPPPPNKEGVLMGHLVVWIPSLSIYSVKAFQFDKGFFHNLSSIC